MAMAIPIFLAWSVRVHRAVQLGAEHFALAEGSH